MALPFFVPSLNGSPIGSDPFGFGANAPANGNPPSASFRNPRAAGSRGTMVPPRSPGNYSPPPVPQVPSQPIINYQPQPFTSTFRDYPGTMSAPVAQGDRLMPGRLMTAPGNNYNRDQLYGTSMYPNGRPLYGGYNSGQIIDRAALPSQPVDGRYAVSPQGRYANGGRYIQPGAYSNSFFPVAPSPAEYNMPGIDQQTGLGSMHVGGQVRNFVQLPGRQFPTLVPQNAELNQGANGRYRIDNARSGYNYNAPLTANVGRIPQLSQEQWAARRQAYQAYLAQKEQTRQANRMITRQRQSPRGGAPMLPPVRMALPMPMYAAPDRMPQQAPDRSKPDPSLGIPIW